MSYVTMPEKKAVSKKKPANQAPPAVSPPVPVSTSKTAAASSPPPPVTEGSIAKLITLTTLLPDSPLGLIWKHVFQEGSQEGFKKGTELFKDKDVKQAFRDRADQGQIVGILAERKEWEAEGHGQWCFDKPLTCVLCNTSFCDEHVKVNVAIQADIVGPPPPPSSTEAAIQVTPSLHSSSSQTNPPPLLVNAEAHPSLWIQLLLLPLLLPLIPLLSIGLKTLPPYLSLPYSPKINPAVIFQLFALVTPTPSAC